MKLVILLCLAATAVLVSGAAKAESNLCKNEIRCIQTEYKEYLKCLGRRRAKRQTCNGQLNSINPQVVQPIPLQSCAGINCNNCLNDCAGTCSGINCAGRCDRSCQSTLVVQPNSPIVVPPIQTIVSPNPPSIVPPIQRIVPPNPPQVIPPIQTIVPPNPPQVVPPISSVSQLVDSPVRYNSNTLVQEKTREIQSTSPNVTTIIKLTNIVNNTNIVNVPTNINNTNINNLDLGTNVTSGIRGEPQSKKEDIRESPDSGQKCCVVVQPRFCEKINSSKGGVRCIHRKHHTCGEECTSDIIHAQVRQPCNGPPSVCPPQVAYIPQPQPRCNYQPTWPYVSCGNRPSSCGGCYDHYGYGFQQYYGTSQPSCGGCYDDGHQPGSLYRQGPFYQPGNYHMPPLTYATQPAAQTSCGNSGCLGNEKIDPVFGAPSYSPYGPFPFYPPVPQYFPQQYMPQELQFPLQSQPQFQMPPANLIQPPNPSIAFDPSADASLAQPFPQGDSVQQSQYSPMSAYPQYPMMPQPCFMPPYYQPQPCPAPLLPPPVFLPLPFPLPNGQVDPSAGFLNGSESQPWGWGSSPTFAGLPKPLILTPGEKKRP